MVEGLLSIGPTPSSLLQYITIITLDPLAYYVWSQVLFWRPHKQLYQIAKLQQLAF